MCEKEGEREGEKGGHLCHTIRCWLCALPQPHAAAQMPGFAAVAPQPLNPQTLKPTALNPKQHSTVPGTTVQYKQCSTVAVLVLTAEWRYVVQDDQGVSSLVPHPLPCCCCSHHGGQLGAQGGVRGGVKDGGG